jgi:hypothetical protein
MSCTAMDVWIDVLLIVTFPLVGVMAAVMLVFVVKEFLRRT